MLLNTQHQKGIKQWLISILMRPVFYDVLIFFMTRNF